KQLLLIAAMRRHRGEGLDRDLRRAVDRDTRRAKTLPARAHRRIADPAREHGLRRSRGLLDHGSRDVVGLAQRGRDHDREHGIDRIVGQANAKRRGVSRRVRVAEHVDRIAFRRCRGQQTVELAHARVAEARERQLLVRDGIGGHDRGAAAVRHDRERRPARREARVQRLGDREEIGVVDHPHDARALERRLEHVVRADERAGMRDRGAAAGRVPPDLHHDDRLRARDRAQRAHETPRVVHAFDVEHDGARLGVEQQVVEDLAEIHVGADSRRDDVREPDIAHARPVEQRGADGTRLRDERDASALRHRLAEARVQARGGTQHAEAVRPDETDAVLARDAHRLVLERAALGPGLAEAGRQDHGGADAGGTALTQHVGHHARGRGDHGEIDALADLRDAREAATRLHLGVLRIHRMDRTREARVEEVPQDDGAERARPLARADHGDGLGLEDPRDLRAPARHTERRHGRYAETSTDRRFRHDPSPSGRCGKNAAPFRDDSSYAAGMTSATSDRPRARSLEPLRALPRLLAPHWPVLAAAIAALLLAAAAQLALPITLRFLIDDGLIVRDTSMIDRYFILLLAVAALFGTFAALRYYLISWLGERVVADLRSSVYARVIRMDPAFFEITRTGEVLSRLTADTTLVQSIAGVGISITLRSAVTFLGSLVLLILTSPALTALIAVLMPVVVVPLVFLGRRVRKLSRYSQDRIADASALAGETINAMQTVQAFTLESLQTRRFNDAVEHSFDVAIARNRVRAMLTAIATMLIFGAIAIVLWVGAHQVVRGTLTFGQLGQFLLYAGYLGLSSAALSEMWGEVQRAAGAMERLIELKDALPSIRTPAVPRALPSPAEGRIAFENVTFRYPSRPESA